MTVFVMKDGEQLPPIPVRDIRDVVRIETVPLFERIKTWNVGDYLWDGCSLDSAKIGVKFIEGGDVTSAPRELSYGELTSQAIKVANALHTLGVRDSDAVALLLPNIVEYYPLTLGTIARGIVCPLNWMLSAENLAELINALHAKVVVGLGPTPGFDIWEKLQDIRPLIHNDTLVLSVAALQGATPLETDLAGILSQADGQRLTFSAARSADDTVAFIHSGGTTGSPKLVRLAHKGAVYKFWTLKNVLGYDANDVIFADYPFFHCAGFINRLLAPMAQGMSVVIPSVWGARDKGFIGNYWKFVEKYKVTQLSAVPTTLSLLAKQLPTVEDISTLRPFATTGSQALPIEVANRIESGTGIRLILTYGSTESATTMTQPPVIGKPRYGSVGLRLPYTSVRTVVLDANGDIVRECDINEIGHVVVKGPGVTTGYLVESHNASAFTKDGSFRTGDLGRLDEDGYLWLTGRAKDLIIRGGHNIDPAMIEEVLQQHPSVLYVAAVGKPDAYAGELPVAYVQPTEGANCSEDELRRFVAARIRERAATPTDIFIIDQMPLSDIRKPLKSQLRLDAARRTFLRVMQETLATISGVDVEARSDSEHGTMVIIRYENMKTDESDAAVAAAMSAFSIPYRLEYKASSHSAGEAEAK
jgi:fatty-acyl-CoA synthase